jgi:hypothetical protein
LSYTLSKTFDYSDDDQLTQNNKDEQVNLAEGTAGLRKEKGVRPHRNGGAGKKNIRRNTGAEGIDGGNREAVGKLRGSIEGEAMALID